MRIFRSYHKPRPIRSDQPKLPLKGATITNCQPKITKDGYILDYTKGGANYSVDYGWTQAGVYNFKFISPTGTTTATYNGFKPCKVTDHLHRMKFYHGRK
jgi:hypothetical protein